MPRSFLTWRNVLVLNADFPSRACRVTPSSRSPNERSRYSASALSVLTNRFSIRTPLCTRSTGRGLFASFIWDIVTNLPTSRNQFFVLDFDVGRSLPCETIPLSHEKPFFLHVLRISAPYLATRWQI